MEKKHFAYTLLALSLIGIVIGMIALFKNSQQSSNPDKAYSSHIFQNKYIAYLELNGPITGVEDGFIVPKSDGASAVKKALHSIQEDSKIKGILLRIDSPGGTVAESQEIFNLLMRIRKDKPIVVAMGDVAASGGYYIASAADKIVANPGTITGSIGVILNAVDISDFMGNKLGIHSNVIKSGTYKDIGSFNRKMTSNERHLLQSMINNVYHQFVSDIKRGRIDIKKGEKPVLTVANLKKYSDGRIFTGEQALTLGYVDYTGDIEVGKRVIQSLVKKHFEDIRKDLPVEPYQTDSSLDQLLKGFLTASMSKNEVRLSNSLPLSYKYPNIPLLILE